jgi:hypothetical protein
MSGLREQVALDVSILFCEGMVQMHLTGSSNSIATKIVLSAGGIFVQIVTPD